MRAFPIIMACIVALSLCGYFIELLGGSMSDFQDPHGWEDDDDIEE